MYKQPAYGHYDIEQTSPVEGLHFAARRTTIDAKNEIQFIAPDAPPVKNEIWSVYMWNGKTGQWLWINDCFSADSVKHYLGLLQHRPA